MHCWHNPQLIVEEMNRNYPVYKEIMDQTFHVHSLKSIITFLSQIENNKKLSIADIGCGTAQISLLFEKHKFTYEGFDLPHTIEHCALKWHPENDYSIFDAQQFNYEFLSKYDCILANAFIDVIQNPLHILNQILTHAKKYVIIHRQEISDSKLTQTTENPAYGGTTIHTIINRDDFNNLLKQNKFTIIKHKSCGFSNWENDGESFLLEKNNG